MRAASWTLLVMLLASCGTDALQGFPCDFEGRCPGRMTCDAESSTCLPGVECFLPEVDCGGSCELLSSSDAHCGACDRACAANERCVDGSCTPDTVNTSCDFCPPGLECINGECSCAGRGDLCGGAICVDLKQAPISCGECFQGCFNGASSCLDGVCVCAPGEKLCGMSCIDVDSDPLNCGDCGRACSTGQKCQAGQCVAACTRNPSDACRDGRCWSVATDREHCGASCARCDDSEFCINGACACPTGATSCGGSCTDTRIDPENCGACGTACALGETCIAGQCACQPGVERCGTECRLLSNDAQHCGACGRACPAGQKCTAGSCKAECPLFMQACADGSCADTQRDPRHCGSCDDACAPGETCADGACVRPEPALGCTTCPCDDCTYSRQTLCCVRAGVPYCLDARRCPP